MKKDEHVPPTLNYAGPRPASPRSPLATWPTVLATVLVLGSLGACMLVSAFFVSRVYTRLFISFGWTLGVIAIAIWRIERNLE